MAEGDLLLLIRAVARREASLEDLLAAAERVLEDDEQPSPDAAALAEDVVRVLSEADRAGWDDARLLAQLGGLLAS